MMSQEFSIWVTLTLLPMAIDLLKIGTATNKQDIESKLSGLVFTINKQ